MKIHPTAIVDPSAVLADSVEVGPYAFVGPNVKVGAGTVLMHHSSIYKSTTLGSGCTLWPFVSVGGDPQDLKYNGEETSLEIGDNVALRECATVNRGTPGGGGVTRVGDGCLLMAYSHVAHDCQLGRGVILSNAVNLAGHVHLDDRSAIGGVTAVHQFTRIGTFCFVGGCSGVSKDLPPYCLCEGNRAVSHGLNIIGLRRAGFTEEAIEALKVAYKLIFRTRTPIKQALQNVREQAPDTPEVRTMVSFIENSERGVAR